MNFTKTKVAKISVIEDSIDLQPIYDFGRAMPFNDMNPNDAKNIDTIVIKETLKSKLKMFSKLLLKVVKASNPQYHPALIEVSIFDPKDRTGSFFFSVFIADKEEAIEKYIKEMDRNLAKRDVYEKDKKIARDRGPIILSRSLHSSAYFSVTNKGAESKQNNIRFNEIGDQPKYIYAGRFNTSNFRFAHVGKDLLEKHVTNFLVAVGENCICELHADGGEFNFNSAILLPLFRPAALFKGERQNIFNGGGMFLFGNIEQPEIESDFVLGLQTNLIKSIFKASHAQIHFDEIDAFKNIFTAMLIHQIKNKLTNQITQEIVELLRRNHLDPAVISTLNEVKISSMNIVKKFSTHLNNLGLKLSQTDIPEIDFAKLERITNELKAKCNLEIQLINEQPAVNAMMKVNPDILEAILDQLIENALKYYKENHIDDRNEKIIVKWEVDPAENIIQISVKSTNTVMEKETLDNYGINQIRDTGSTGLGGLFINNILEQIDAKIFGDGRYFQPLNENEGFCLNIKFNLYNQKNDN